MRAEAGGVARTLLKYVQRIGHSDKEAKRVGPVGGAFCAPSKQLAFRLAVEGAGMRHRYIKPRRPPQNGKVERSHRIDSEEFWGRHNFRDRADGGAEAA